MTIDGPEGRADDPTAPGSADQPDLVFGRRALIRSAFAAATAGVLAQACTRSDRLAPTSTDGATTSTPATTVPAPTSTTSTPTTSTTSSTSTTPSTTATTSTSSTSTTTTTEPPPEDSEPGNGPPGAYDRDALYVALYGFPGSRTLGVLGEQDAAAGAQRAAEVAAPYADFGRRVVPTFEVIASVAAADAGADGDYSNEYDSSRFDAHLATAAAHGMHVVFDLQSGRTRFPDQAREYEALWLQPHASIALDPEWRVGPDERPGGGRIGTVDASEVNETIDYIDALISQHGLPPKMCIVHQFAESMITNKPLIRGTLNVQVLIQMDGFGTLELKQGTWARVVSTLPDGALTGWKNFYDEDQPTPTPAETMASQPQPSYVSYQ